MANLTLQQLKQIVGDPIVFLQVFDPRQNKMVELTDADLSPTAMNAILTWINNHIGNA